MNPNHMHAHKNDLGYLSDDIVAVKNQGRQKEIKYVKSINSPSDKSRS